MSFRAKTAVKRSHRPASEGEHRRTLLLNIGFGVVVIVALVILGGAAFASWYGDHLENLATVNGQGITKDDFRDRARVEVFNLDYQETQIRARMQDGKLDSASGESQISEITTARQSIDTDVMEKLIDSTLQTQLAQKIGVAVTDQQVDEQMTKAATADESRHVWVIGVKPEVTEGATEATAEQKAAAKAKAEQALADLKAGHPWEDEAKILKDDVYSSSNGDAGWLTKASSAIDQPLEDAIFALPEGGLTDVMEGTDGLFRIGRVTEIAPATVDQAFQLKVKDAGLNVDSFRKVAKATALQTAINDKLVSDVTTQPTAQRHVEEIVLNLDPQGTQGSGDEVQVRHILFSPNDDPQAAQTLAATDPAWKKAEDEANAMYALLQKDPAQFQDLATKNSDDEGTKADGGLLPYYTKVSLDKAFGDAIFQDGLQKDQLLPIVKSSFGYHIIQFLDRRKQPSDRMADIVAQATAPGADFGALAKQYSESPTKDNGGDAGWIAKNQLDSVREISLFRAPVGGISETITVPTGIYVYKILEEQMRLPDASQIETIKANAFNNWYTGEKQSARIERLFSSNQASVPAVQ